MPRYCRLLTLSLVLLALIVTATPTLAQLKDNTNSTPTTLVDGADTIIIIDSDWTTPTLSSDCATGMADDIWELTLSDAKQVTVSVQDCCCPGDYFEVFVNGNLIGTTPNLAPPWGCSFTGPLSSGSFTVPLCPGDHVITVRDAGFDGHSLQEIFDENMCPAGFTVSGTLSNLLTSGFQAVAVSRPPSTMQAKAARRADPQAARKIQQQIQDLTPFITTDSRGVQRLDVREARRQGVSSSTLRFGHKMIALNNRIIIAAQHGRQPDLDENDFKFIEPYYLQMAQQGDPCTDRDNPATCPTRVESGLCFATREDVVDHLESQGYHRTANYAGGASGNDYSRVVPFSGCSSTSAFREQALIHMEGSYWTYNLQGPEPNPEVLSYIFDWPYVSWPGYVRWWHLVFC